MRAPALAALMIWSGLAIALGMWVMGRAAPAERNLTCRPSDPARALAQDPRPTVLMFGNSLIFDHNWRLPDVSVINCARQGLTLKAALPLSDLLPDVTPSHIVISFGSVELLRAARTGTPPDINQFAAHITALSETLSQRWPNAQMLWLSLPTLNTSPAPALIPTLNAQFPALNLIQTDSVLTLPADTISYDGTHLTEAAYLQLETALSLHLAK